jgi:hypothetical protein
MQQASLITFYYLTPIGIAVHAICLALFAWRKELRQEYPFFFSYLFFQALSSALLHLLFFRTFVLHSGNKMTYFYLYWIQSALVDIFALAVFRELFFAAFKPFAGLRDMARVVFRWAAVAMILIGAAVVFSSSLPSAQRITFLVVSFERAICIMQCALLLFLFMGSSYLGLSRRSNIFGLSLGFGILAATNLAFYVAFNLALPLMGYPRTLSAMLLRLPPTIAFALAPAIWAVYAMFAEPAREVVDVPVNSPLLRWNEIAAAFGHSGGRVAFVEQPESFMPEAKRFVPDVNKEAYARHREVQRTS